MSLINHNNFKLQIFPSLSDLFKNAVEKLELMLKESGENNFIVPGGKTPKKFYLEAANNIHAWYNARFILSDERIVDEISPLSNYGMVQRNLIKIVKNNDVRLKSILNGLPVNEPKLILESLNSSILENYLPFKAAFLGLGSDGHTASLFNKSDINNLNQYPFILTKRRRILKDS